MSRRGTSFSLKDLDMGDKIAKMLIDLPAGVDKEIDKRMGLAVNMVYQVAHQKRPYITQRQAKMEGRRRLKNGKYHVVSDPEAKAGVPVGYVGGGALQASITKRTQRVGSKRQGIISVTAPYAEYLEFGTPNMAARPFMRPALMLTKDALVSLFKKPLFQK